MPSHVYPIPAVFTVAVDGFSLCNNADVTDFIKGCHIYYKSYILCSTAQSKDALSLEWRDGSRKHNI